jgi:hypothetical protein
VGESEDRCTFVLTGHKEVEQRFYECTTCGFVDDRHFCGICAVICHKGHKVRALERKRIGFCNCGAGACLDDCCAPCQALEEVPLDVEKVYPSSMCVDPSGNFLYLLDSEFGLVKLGSGRNGTLAGKVYRQDSRLSVHAGGQVTFAAGAILLRTPLLGPTQLLKIDLETFKVPPHCSTVCLCFSPFSYSGVLSNLLLSLHTHVCCRR